MTPLVYQVTFSGVDLADDEVIDMMRTDYRIDPKGAFPDWALWVFNNTDPIDFLVSKNVTKLVERRGGYPSGYETYDKTVDAITYTVHAVLDGHDAVIAKIAGTTR